MVFGILTAVAACPAIIGTTEAVRQGQQQNAREEHRGRKSNLTINLPKRNAYSKQFDGAMVVLKDNKLYIDTEHSRLGANLAHPFSGYYLPVPWIGEKWKKQGFKNGEGMVTTISDDPPFLNWVYLDRNTHEVKYGIRVEAEPHHVGPWDCTPIDRRLTFEGWEGFIIVQEDENSDLWALYFDRDDDGLRSEGRVGTQDKRMLEVEVSRKEKRRTKLTSDEERIDRIRDQMEKEKEQAQAELEVTPIAPAEEKSSSQGTNAHSATVIEIEIERKPETETEKNLGTTSEHDDDTLRKSVDQGLSKSLNSFHISSNITSDVNDAKEEQDAEAGAELATHHANDSRESFYQQSSHSASSFHTASFEMSSEIQTSTTTW
ncbi:hypothetical protein VTO58DRAFT_107898 [Aureobasidium pullulans]|nr:hypothetical protein JADG_004643 [Aureobasidium pullulans]